MGAMNSVKGSTEKPQLGYVAWAMLSKVMLARTTKMETGLNQFTAIITDLRQIGRTQSKRRMPDSNAECIVPFWFSLLNDDTGVGLLLWHIHNQENTYINGKTGGQGILHNNDDIDGGQIT